MIEIINTDINGVKIIKPKIHVDSRGCFLESYNTKEFNKKIGSINFVQDNESLSKFGVLRGLHYQKKPYEQSKLVRVVYGKIQDVAVDIRKDSKTYMQYVSVLLDDKEKKQIFIPKGFAHGFLVLSDYAIVNYKVDNFYNFSSETNIKFNDSKINIDWKLDFDKIMLSDRDS